MEKIRGKLLKTWLFEKRTDLILFFYIALLSLVPIIFTWGKLAIGGDVLIPFNYQGMEKFLYQWTNLQNGIYYYINYFPLYYFYQLVNALGVTIYQISYLIFFLLGVTAGIGTLKLTKLFFQNKPWLFYLLPITFYLLSPALLNGWHYLYIYSFIPWFVYLIFKVIKRNKIEILDVISLSIILFFSSLDFPNPKYVFHLFFITFIIFILSAFFRIINFNFFIKNIWKALLFFVISLYIFLPLSYFAFEYSPLEYGVGIKKDYKQVGNMMDYGSTKMDRMVRLHHNNLNLDGKTKTQYISNPIIVIFSFIFIIIVTLNFIRKKDYTKFNNKSELIFLILVVLYLFFACGPNPPFGKIYEYIVVNFSLFAFLRTTAGAVFFLSIFYSILLVFFVDKIQNKRNLIIISFIVAILITGYPFLKGDFYKNNFSFLNQYADGNKHGVEIPSEYFEIKESLDNKKIDAKLLHINSNLSYINTTWGYFGVIYNFLYKNDQLGRTHIYSNIANHNVRFLFNDESIIGVIKNENKFSEDEKLLNKKGFLEFNRVLDNKFLPHFYIPRNVIQLNQSIKEFLRITSDENYDIQSVIYFTEQNKDKLEKIPNNNQKQNSNLPILEFKKINPTKYRVRVHGAQGISPFVFSESFHDGWMVYLVIPFKSDSNDQISKYKILDGNSDDQASADELQEFIDKGFVTDIGDGKEKSIDHKKWDNGKEKLDYAEKYNIDFISKNFQGTIQNDNLPDGRFYETWLAKSMNNVAELPEKNHLMANGYANSWVIDTDEICAGERDNGFCVKNPDGSYDMELVIEFWPQRLFYVGLGISGATLLGCLAYLGYDFVKRRKNDRLKILR